LSHHYQVPAIILVDQYLADSIFVVEETLDVPDTVTPYTIDDSDMDTPAGYRRYALVENGISPRALPCQGRALVKACSDEHDEEGHITEDAHMRDAMVKKRFAKAKAMRDEIRPPDSLHAEAETLLVCWGSIQGVMQEAVNILRAKGHDCGGVHFTDLWPFPDRATKDILGKAKQFVMVEQNHTAQLGQLIRQQTGLNYTEAVLETSGRPLRAHEVARALESILT
jgi:2-oxoglutarate ferredoxin oxidoreductase subunit alpha